MTISFSNNHDGDLLVIVDGKVSAIAKDCEGYQYLKAMAETDSPYEKLKNELTRIVVAHYQGETKINDIRAAIHAVDLMVEQFGAIELTEIAKAMAVKK